MSPPPPPSVSLPDTEDILKFLPEQFKAEGLHIIAEYSDGVRAARHPQGLTPLLQHEIDTGDTLPQNIRQYRMEWVKREAARQQILEMLNLKQWQRVIPRGMLR